MAVVQHRAMNVLAQGHTGTMSKRPTQYVRPVFPTHLVKARGPYVWDEKQKYIDFVSGLGVSSIGYNHPKVVEAVQKQASEAVSMTFPHPIEVEVAEMLIDMFPAIERIRFLKTGSEACSAAIRIARASYPNSHLVGVEGYHGWHDAFVSLTPPATGIPHQLDIAKLSETNLEQLDIAIIEPIELDATATRQAEVAKLREKVSCLIFDEVVTGFRVPEGAAHKWWKMDPDIICLGKGIASGYPLAVVGGKEALMDEPSYFVSSTYSGDAVSLAACKATIEEIKKYSFKELYFYANKFVAEFNKMMTPLGVTIEGYGTRGMLDTSQLPVQIFMEQACLAGLIFGKAFFYNFSHMLNDVDEYVLNIISDIATTMKAGAQLKGYPPQDIFKR